MHIESPLGFIADFPEHTQVLEDSSAGPNTAQYGLLGEVLVTVIKDDTSVQGAAQANGWAHLMSDFYLEERKGTLLTEGELNIPGRSSYAVLVGYTDQEGSAKVAASVGTWQNDRFIGTLVIWPYINPETEPRVDLLKEIVSSIRPA
ncbi:hypothetical protein ACFC25_16300 [Pseudarthrobacter sp. NPDC055928]|uniref:hypothetical protein n=1 Tax=Pseudarthrobacter sp. NPDC055928 TaxID=3345661 RepID=UPI0035D70DE5